MVKSLLLLLFLPLTLSSQTYEEHVKIIYTKCELENKLSYKVFLKGLTGYYGLKYDNKIKGDKLVIVDFRQASHEKRFYVIDLTHQKLIHRTLVAHGEKSGNKYALFFSNQKGSHKSSLGFYITTTLYVGCNGPSLYLKGVDEGYNHHAEERLIVVHGADYVSTKEMGRSKGCLALSSAEAKIIIPLIKKGNSIFVYATSYKNTPLSKDKALQYYEQLKIDHAVKELLNFY